MHQQSTITEIGNKLADASPNRSPTLAHRPLLIRIGGWIANLFSWYRY
jgi:hypothetical protein